MDEDFTREAIAQRIHLYAHALEIQALTIAKQLEETDAPIEDRRYWQAEALAIALRQACGVKP